MGTYIIIIKAGMSWLWIAGTLGDNISLSLSLTKIEFPPSHQMATLLFMVYINALDGGRVTDKVFLKKHAAFCFSLTDDCSWSHLFSSRYQCIQLERSQNILEVLGSFGQTKDLSFEKEQEDKFGMCYFSWQPRCHEN